MLAYERLPNFFGAFKRGSMSQNIHAIEGTINKSVDLKYEANLQVPVASENRPNNLNLKYFMKV